MARLRLLLIIPTLLGISLAADYRPLVVGAWQCQSQIRTDYGNSLVIGDTELHDDGRLTGVGNVLLSYPGFATEIPMATTLMAQWRFEDNSVIVSQVSGDITSPYPLLNTIADSFEAQILQQQALRAKLVKIGRKIMAFRAADGTEVHCVKAGA